MRPLVSALVALALAPSTSVTQGRIPSVDDLLNLKAASAAQISPDGRWVAYSVTSTDWKTDAFVGQLWVANAATGDRRQLTRHARGAANARWSPNGEWISFTSARDDDKNQLFVIRPDGGEPQRLTKAETGVTAYHWSPDGKWIAFTAPDPEGKAAKDRKEAYGAFEIVRKDNAYSHLYTFEVARALEEPQAGRRRTGGTDFTVGAFDWSPDGKQIAFSAAINADITQAKTADIYVVNLSPDTSAKGVTRKIVAQPGPDNNPV